MRREPSAVPASIVALLGILVVVTATAAYTYESAALAFPTPGEVAFLATVGEMYFGVLLAGVGLVLFGIGKGVAERIAEIRDRGLAPLSPGWVIPYVISVRKYRRSFVSSALLYGIFYAVITSIIVIQPTVDFSQAYGASIPSAQVTPVANAPLFTPMVTVYVVNHLGLLLTPLTILLLLATSILVGLNFALAIFAFDSRAKGAGRGWVSGIGAVVGLFTGCPTCAGLFFANFLGGMGAVSFVTVLGYYQPAFILLSIPVLLLAPYLTTHSLSKVFREGCVFLPKPV